jgi:hypothetical protein
MSQPENYFERIRKVHQRISKMIELCEDEELKSDLKVLKDDLSYCPPEMIYRWAGKMNDLLIRKIGMEPLPGWQTEMINAYIK